MDGGLWGDESDKGGAGEEMKQIIFKSDKICVRNVKSFSIVRIYPQIDSNFHK